VTGTKDDSIVVHGDSRAAVFAQSMGGGGGNGGINISGGIVTDGAIVFGLGGLGGDAGTGGDVDVDVENTLIAVGKKRSGIVAQSLGGGGGNGGLNVSGELVYSKESNTPSITVGIGGFGGAGSISGNATVHQEGSITTSGEWSHGILAQSLAGGGG